MFRLFGVLFSVGMAMRAGSLLVAPLTIACVVRTFMDGASDLREPLLRACIAGACLAIVVAVYRRNPIMQWRLLGLGAAIGLGAQVLIRGDVNTWTTWLIAALVANIILAIGACGSATKEMRPFAAAAMLQIFWLMPLCVMVYHHTHGHPDMVALISTLVGFIVVPIAMEEVE